MKIEKDINDEAVLSGVYEGNVGLKSVACNSKVRRLYKALSAE